MLPLPNTGGFLCEMSFCMICSGCVFLIEAYEIYHTSAHTVLCDSAEAYTDTACPSCTYSSHSPVAESVCVLRETSGRADSVVSLDFYNTSGYYIGR